jgi:PAS domain S-box-containing protein
VRAATITPTAVERTFGDDEIIVSKTDAKGRITYANDVFVRISGYDESHLIGSPHSIIRHPDMPRAVFKLLWDTIVAGEEVFAYVKNLAADGAYYWVFAHVTATFGPDGLIAGYHSSRRTVTPAALAKVEPLYGALLAEERRHRHTPTALAASTALLQKTLGERGLTYDEWLWSVEDQPAVRA